MGESNGQGPLTQKMVDVLERIAGSLTGIEGGIKATNACLDTLHGDMLGLREDVLGLKAELPYRARSAPLARERGAE